MKRIIPVSTLASLFVFAACTQSAHPTRPSPLAAQPEGLFTQTAIARIVDWSLLTAGGGNEASVVTGEDVPSAPSNLAFTLSGSTVVLTWSAPASANATSYVVEAGTATGQSNITTFNTGSTATTLTVTSVPNGTYFVRVRARNADGNSAASNEITIVVGAGPCPAPSAPAGFAASASGNTVTLTWGAVAGALGYVIEAGTSPGAANIITFDTGSSATSFSGNAPNGTYYLRVRARTACGTSTTSNEASVTVGGAPPPSGSVTGRWLGLVANGDGATSTPNECGVERWDWQFDLVQNGTAVSGTLTQTSVVSGCEPPGRVSTLSLTGTVSGNNVTLTGSPAPGRRIDISGTFSASRMTGTGLANGGAFGTNTFAVNRQ